MKSDKTFPQSSTSKTATGKPFSNKLLKTQTMSLKEAKTQQNDESQKSLIEDKTSTSESTAHGTVPPNEYAPAPTPTPRRHEPKEAAAEAPRQIPSKLAPKLKPIQAAPALAPTAPAASNHPIQPPRAFFEDSNTSPTLTEREGQQPENHPPIQTSTGGKRSNEEFLKQFKENIYQIQGDNEFLWIRKLSTRKWITFFDTVLAGFTLLFFSTAFYLIFHINPTLEYKLTPEFQLKIRPFTVKDSFQRCNHSFWIRTNDSILPSINFIQCYRNFQYGRNFFEAFSSSTPHSLDVCNTDRIEIHPCYTENSKSLNIFWGVNDAHFDDYFCNGSYVRNNSTMTLYSINPPVQKYTMLKNITSFLNQTISSAAFFFQCPTCSFMDRTNTGYLNESDRYNYSIHEIAASIPPGIRTCDFIITTGYKGYLDHSRFIKQAPKFFSHQVFPFEIVEDEEFCE